ncbi:hypothetical protein JTE90_018805 [Oedothorax gibbosus]|uniref:THAP-type domain-containing protein n=1 Tax=Oedothorax gibbosus TaxID=931172 RepID=A0AAV6TPQ2_9ARAC|nr:hypothetical protein JTE90_018805 [Oedothorax gibbosus]
MKVLTEDSSLVLKDHSCVCSVHFHASDFVQGNKLRKLKATAVPACFLNTSFKRRKVEMEAAEALLQLREQSPTLLRDGAIDLYQLPKRRKVEFQNNNLATVIVGQDLDIFW